jgi:hypothetical protein
MTIPMSFAVGRLLVLSGLLVSPVALRAQSGAVLLEVDYTAPTGYAARPEGGLLWMTPQAPGPVAPPCLYALMPPFASRGSLEADAEAALGETAAAGMQRSSDYRIARRGVAAAGWPYFLTGGNFTGQNPAGGFVSLAVMVMVFPASANRVSAIFGIGNPAECQFNDVPFAQLFHSLRPHGWSAPAANALERDLIGTWGGRALSGHTFHADGRYSSSAAAVLHGNAISAEPDGRYVVRGSDVTTTTRGGRAEQRFRVYICDKWNNGRWERTLTVLYGDSGVPSVAEYVREGP